MLFLVVKETNYPINGKSMREYSCFLGKNHAMHCACSKDSVFNHSSSGVPRGGQGYLARTELLVMFDPAVTRTGVRFVCRLFTQCALCALHGNAHFVPFGFLRRGLAYFKSNHTLGISEIFFSIFCVCKAL